MRQTLLRTLMQSCLASSTSHWAAGAADHLQAATVSDWQYGLSQLGLHRLAHHVFYSLRTHKLAKFVPDCFLRGMAVQYLQNQNRNKLLLKALGDMLRRLETHDMHPVVMKGIVMAGYFYPDPGVRQMSDLDLLFPPREIDRALAVFGDMGYSVRRDVDGGDAYYVVNESGVLCDVHYRFGLFEGKELHDLTTQIEFRDLAVPTLRVFEPNAMIVHLVVHLSGHLRHSGPILSWFFDIAFVLRRWGELLELDRIEALMPNNGCLMLFGSVLTFLQMEFDECVPPQLVALARVSTPSTLSKLLRQRRLRAWGLPSLRGWKRLIATNVGAKPNGTYPELQPTDLFMWMGDEIRDRHARRELRRHAARHTTSRL